MNYKDTLNLPKTDFSMKANLTQKEPEWLAHWEKIGLYELLRKKYKDKKKFILHDGPPYANGNIHIGHALNKILKDIIVKYNSMQGFDAPYIPGWDCHGLPVEHQLFKELKLSKDQIDQVEFRKKAANYALKYVEIQKEEFKRLGVLGDWDNPYLTLKKEYVAEILRAFAKLVDKGYIYKGLKPINWCIRCETALAEAEVEYQDHNSPSVYVKFKLCDSSPKPTYFLIWTTTPWTLVSNVAVALHPDLEYAFVELEDKEVLVFAKVLVDSVLERAGIKNYKITKTVKGKDLEKLVCQHPFFQRTSLVVLDGYVSSVEGTGCVHIAPGHGAEDFAVGAKYKLETLMPVGAGGKFDSSAGKFSGVVVFKANEAIIEELRNNRNLLHNESISHSYPHCWRCKTPLITRSTLQWFMNVDHNKLREKLIKVLKDINWVPKEGEARISAMIENRPHWCLSRQRYWGVGIPAFYCVDCKKEILDKKLVDVVANIIEEEGSDAWFAKSAQDLLPKGFKCPHCRSEKINKETDILDVWFDSGVSSQAVVKVRKELSYPSDLYLEGSDQHRGWFQTSLIPAMAIDNRSPFKEVLTHGFVVDGGGRKMSKSLGNVIAPQEIMKDYGAEILRLWVASCDYSEDIRISKEIIARLVEGYRKIRNTFRFLLGNLYDFNPKKDVVSYSKMLEVDKWALARLSLVLKDVQDNFNKYQFYKVYQSAYNFCSQDLSSFYLDMLKDRLYTFKNDSLERRSSQTAMFEILDSLVRVIAPFLCFTAEEIYSNMNKREDSGSAHLLSWPKLDKNWQDQDLIQRWQKIFSLRNVVLKEIEEKRSQGLIRSSQEANIEIFIESDKEREFLKAFKDLNSIFIVSQAEIKNLKETKEKEKTLALPSFSGKISVAVSRAEGEKCPRCWNYSVSAGQDHSGLCQRCKNAIG